MGEDQNAELDDLLDDLLDGTLTPDGYLRLNQALADPARCARAKRYFRLHQRLPLLLREQQGDRFVNAVCREIHGQSGSFVQHQRQRRKAAPQRATRNRWPAPFGWLIAGTAAAALVLGVGALRIPAQPPGTAVDGDALVRTADGSWLLANGSTQLTIEPQAIGLRVRTPHLLATVHGTTFQLTAGDASSRIEVTEGLVQVTANDVHAWLGAGTGITADAEGLQYPIVHRWNLGAEPGWIGTAVPGGLRTTDNPGNPGSGVVQAPHLPQARAPVLTTTQVLVIRFESMADIPQTLAGVLLALPTSGHPGQAWLCERSVAPGTGELRLPLREFTPREGARQPLEGQTLTMAAVVCWGAAIDTVVVHELMLVEEYR